MSWQDERLVEAKAILRGRLEHEKRSAEARVILEAHQKILETRVTDPVTGGQKGSKPAQLGALCPRALLEVGRVAGFGATKYARFNFLRGYAWSLSADALLRHMCAWLDGEDRDPESGCHHMAHVAWHGLALTAFCLRNVGTDDRAHAAVPQKVAR